jgi:hypothetical protein
MKLDDIRNKKEFCAQPQTRRVASTSGLVAVDSSETALELSMLGHPLGMHTCCICFRLPFFSGNAWGAAEV